MTQEVSAADLTGEYVLAVRKHYKLSRQKFSEMCEFPSQSRLSGIELKESWKPGDREAVAAVITTLLTNPPVDKRGRRLGETAEQRLDRLDAGLKANGHLIRAEDSMPDPNFDPNAEPLIFDADAQDENFVTPSLEAPPSFDELMGVTGNIVSGNTVISDNTFGGGNSTGVILVSPPLSDMESVRDAYGMNGTSREPLPSSNTWSELQQVTDELTTVMDAMADGSSDPAFEVNVFADEDNGIVPLKMISNSEIGTWQRCRRKWWLSYYRRLALAQTDYSGPRAIGNRIHRALAAWYVPEGQERTDPRDALERAIVEDWTALSQERDLPEEAMTELYTSFTAACSLERAMIEGYVQWIEETGADTNLIVTAPETAVHADLKVDLDGEQIPIRVVAKYDVRLTRVSDGVRMFEDHKSMGEFTTARKTVHMDPQMLHYHLLEWLTTEEGEARCDGAIYNMLRKVKRTANAKPPFYDRLEIRHNQIEIENYKTRVLGASRDILRAERDLRNGGDPMSIVYPNPIAKLCTYDCDFFAICHMFDDGSRVEDALTGLYREVDPMERYENTGILDA